MSTKPEKADDDIDALEALESEEKEYLKVRLPTLLLTFTIVNQIVVIIGCRN
jgi:hypothetical protein